MGPMAAAGICCYRHGDADRTGKHLRRNKSLPPPTLKSPSGPRMEPDGRERIEGGCEAR